MTAATYQYVDLPDASVVTTRALLTARENITDTVAARAMMCIHGGAGFGKTLAVNTCLRELEPGEDVRKITFRARPTARAVRYELFTALDLAGEPPRHPSEFDRLLKTALAERPRTFLVDEAQWLNGEAFEYFRYLWDEPSTQLAIIFVGGEGCHTVLRREPMLSSRIFIWQHFTRLTPDEVLRGHPAVPPGLGRRRPRRHRLRRQPRRTRQLPRLGPADRPHPHRPGPHRPPPRRPGTAALGLQPPRMTAMPPAVPSPVAVVIDPGRRCGPHAHRPGRPPRCRPAGSPCTPARAPPAKPASPTTFSPPWANRPCSRAAFPPAVSPPGKPPPPGSLPCPSPG